MQPPFERQQAHRTTRHHLLYEKPEWKAERKSQRVHELGSFIVRAIRAPHDYVHQVVKPVPVPNFAVLDVMYDIGREHIGIQNDADRIAKMLKDMTGFAETVPSPYQAHDMLEVATSINAQMSVLNFMKGIRG